MSARNYNCSMRTLEEITEILLFGDASELKTLKGTALSYDYCPCLKRIIVAYGHEGTHMVLAAEEPNCVKEYGESHVFAPGAPYLCCDWECDPPYYAASFLGRLENKHPEQTRSEPALSFIDEDTRKPLAQAGLL